MIIQSQMRLVEKSQMLKQMMRRPKIFPILWGDKRYRKECVEAPYHGVLFIYREEENGSGMRRGRRKSEKYEDMCWISKRWQKQSICFLCVINTHWPTDSMQQQTSVTYWWMNGVCFKSICDDTKPFNFSFIKAMINP